MDEVPGDYDEAPHAYLCVQHGGSPACEEKNKEQGFICPKCIAEKHEREPD